MPKQLSLDRFQELLSYNPETGNFRWLESRGRVSAGQIAGNLKTDSGYILIKLEKNDYRAHRLAWLYVKGEWPSNQIDHINGNRADNRICNLREADRFQNSANVKLKSGRVGLKGAHKAKLGWVSRICAKGRRYRLGFFKTEKEAHSRYLEEAKKLHGEFARAS